jgi:hypothetical protein
MKKTHSNKEKLDEISISLEAQTCIKNFSASLHNTQFVQEERFSCTHQLKLHII